MPHAHGLADTCMLLFVEKADVDVSRQAAALSPYQSMRVHIHMCALASVTCDLTDWLVTDTAASRRMQVQVQQLL